MDSRWVSCVALTVGKNARPEWNHVLIAPDKFKGSLTATQVAAAIADGIGLVRPDLELTSLPVADGGDGTVDAAVASGYRRVPVTVNGPMGQPVLTSYARRGDDAVVELADVCGLSRLPGGALWPLDSGTFGLGQIVAGALDAGCTSVVLGIGGSASTDGGAGMLSALGARLLDFQGRPIAGGARGLAEVAHIDLSGLHPQIRSVELRLACDVDNPLVGPQGAAAIYGPQKGATTDEVAFLDRALDRWADLVASVLGREARMTPGAGAAGGVGFAAMTLLEAVPAPGATTVFQLLGLTDRMAAADLVITGEGSLDEQTLNGKAPAGVARSARIFGIPVIAVCGRNLLTKSAWRAAGFRGVYALTELESDPERSIREAASLLRRIGRRIAGDLAPRLR